MSQLKQLLAQIDELQKQVLEVRMRETAEATLEARRLIADYQLTAEDVFGNKKRATAPSKGPAKYQDLETGSTWTGKGRTPTWLIGKIKEDHLIKPRPTNAGPQSNAHDHI